METMVKTGVLNNNKEENLDLLTEKLEKSIDNASEVIVVFATDAGEVHNNIIVENYDINANTLEIVSKDFEVVIDIDDAAVYYENEICDEFIIEDFGGTELHLQFL